MPEQEDQEVTDPEKSERRQPATGERADHRAAAPGVELPEEAEEEPEPGEHPNP